MGLKNTGVCIGLLVITLFIKADGFAQQTVVPQNSANTAILLTQHASIYCKSTLTEADKAFIVSTFLAFDGKVISCTASPSTQFINLVYNDNLLDRDVLEVLQMNGYSAYLLKDNNIKVALMPNGESMEILVK